MLYIARGCLALLSANLFHLIRSPKVFAEHMQSGGTLLRRHFLASTVFIPVSTDTLHEFSHPFVELVDSATEIRESLFALLRSISKFPALQADLFHTFRKALRFLFTSPQDQARVPTFSMRIIIIIITMRSPPPLPSPLPSLPPCS